MNRDEQAVQNLISCFKTLQSAISATPKLIQDFKRAKQDGEAQLSFHG